MIFNVQNDGNGHIGAGLEQVGSSTGSQESN